jgi:ketosteroid isomerase-like protein
MMANEDLTGARKETALEYFRRVDSGDPSILDLMTEDVQIYFPKFGVGVGKDAVVRAAQGMMSTLQRIEHDFERMNIITAGDFVVVEGFEKGVSADGTEWPIQGRSEGRYCNVFEFSGSLIKRVHIYVDPDFTSTHTERFLWGFPIGSHDSSKR